MDHQIIEGVWPVMPTPYDEKGGIDTKCVAALVKWYADSGCDGVLVSGSGGEFPYISDDERAAMIRAALDATGGKFPVMCGMGALGTKLAADGARSAMKAGAASVLVALPTYYPVTVEKAIDHFKAVAQATDGKVLYYHFPLPTRFDPGADGVAKICDLDGVIGTKMSRPSVKEMATVAKLVTKRPFSIMSGTILVLKECMNIGGAGVIGILPAVYPAESVAWHKALKSGDTRNALKSWAILRKSIQLLGGFKAPAIAQYNGLKLISRMPTPISLGESSPHGRIKEALRLRGFDIRTDTRSPLASLTDTDAAKVATLLKKLKIADAVGEKNKKIKK